MKTFHEQNEYGSDIVILNSPTLEIVGTTTIDVTNLKLIVIN